MRILGRVVSYVVLVLIGLIGIAPFVYLLILSFKSQLDYPRGPAVAALRLVDDQGELQHRSSTTTTTSTFVKNSIIVTGVSTLIALGLGVPAGVRLLATALPRQRHLGLDDPQLPVHAADRGRDPDLPDDPIVRPARTATSGSILPYIAFSLPLVIWIMIGFFDEIPREIDEAAMVDGLTRPQVLLPRPAPARHGRGSWLPRRSGSSSSGTSSSSACTSSARQDQETIPIAASALLTVESPINYNIAAAVGVLTVIPVLLFVIVVQRYIVRGITAGAVR